MTVPDNLNDLDPLSFQHMVNDLCIRVLGAGYNSFAPGPDGGRDGLFEKWERSCVMMPKSSARWWSFKGRYSGFARNSNSRSLRFCVTFFI